MSTSWFLKRSIGAAEQDSAQMVLEVMETVEAVKYTVCATPAPPEGHSQSGLPHAAFKDKYHLAGESDQLRIGALVIAIEGSRTERPAHVNVRARQRMTRRMIFRLNGCLSEQEYRSQKPVLSRMSPGV
jgi:hypothetical protein